MIGRSAALWRAAGTGTAAAAPRGAHWPARQNGLERAAAATPAPATRAKPATPIGENRMQRVTITIDDELMTELDRIIAARGYQNRSEAIRDLARAGIREAGATLDAQRDCVAAVVYVYDHAARELSKRLTETFHDHHELSLSSLHVHLDHDSCMEVTVLQGQDRGRAALRRSRDRRARRAPRPRGADADPGAPAHRSRAAPEARPRRAAGVSARRPCAAYPRYAILRR